MCQHLTRPHQNSGHLLGAGVRMPGALDTSGRHVGVVNVPVPGLTCCAPSETCENWCGIFRQTLPQSPILLFQLPLALLPPVPANVLNHKPPMRWCVSLRYQLFCARMATPITRQRGAKNGFRNKCPRPASQVGRQR